MASRARTARTTSPARARAAFASVDGSIDRNAASDVFAWIGEITTVAPGHRRRDARYAVASCRDSMMLYRWTTSTSSGASRIVEANASTP
jgi:hypothetical protein